MPTIDHVNKRCPNQLPQVSTVTLTLCRASQTQVIDFRRLESSGQAWSGSCCVQQSIPEQPTVMPWQQDTCPIWSTLLSCIRCIKSGLLVQVDLVFLPGNKSVCLLYWLCVISLNSCILSLCLFVCVYYGRLGYCLLLFWLRCLQQELGCYLQAKHARKLLAYCLV